jgi:hypothetical protein
MLIPRLASTALRAAQFICAAVVLGLTSYLLHLNHAHHLIAPFGRLFFSVVVAAISVVASLIWMLPTTSHVANYIADLLFCALWFAVFGLLQDSYEDDMTCGSKWHWEDMALKNGVCGQWNGAQAFAFISAMLWFASFVLGLLVWKSLKVDRPVVPADRPATTSG